MAVSSGSTIVTSARSSPRRVMVHHGRPVRTADTQVSLNPLCKLPKRPRMVALVDQISHDHVKGQLETLQSRSGTL
eukprot:340686-Rhodomonas_salina.1